MNRTLVFLAGALGDQVLTWPLLRALQRRGDAVTVVGELGKARLASRALGVHALDGESRWVSRLWMDADAAPIEKAQEAAGSADIVIGFIIDEHDPLAGRWRTNVQHAAEARDVHLAGPPGSPSRIRLWSWAGIDADGGASLITPRHADIAAPIILHIGAGGETKRWSLGNFIELAARLRAHKHAVELIAGEVEHERLSREDRDMFARAGGRLLTSLDQLADAFTHAQAFIGCDTGPTHLAAQLGVPTIALFGPTDPHIWKPIGPTVRVIAPGRPSPMTWLSVNIVETAMLDLINLIRAGKP